MSEISGQWETQIYSSCLLEKCRTHLWGCGEPPTAATVMGAASSEAPQWEIGGELEAGSEFASVALLPSSQWCLHWQFLCISEGSRK